MSTENLPPEDIFGFITGDFESSWDSLAANATAKNRCNFVFGLQVTVLLEFLCRLCLSDQPRPITDFATSLYAIEPKYFTTLPFTVRVPHDFELPTHSSKGRELLHVVFHLVRNGQAHQYQQTRAEFANGGALIITLGGAEYGLTLDRIRAAHSAHLAFHTESNDMSIVISPGVMFLDLKKAAEDAKLLQRGLTISHFSQKVSALLPTVEQALLHGGHTRIP